MTIDADYTDVTYLTVKDIGRPFRHVRVGVDYRLVLVGVDDQDVRYWQGMPIRGSEGNVGTGTRLWGMPKTTKEVIHDGYDGCIVWYEWDGTVGCAG